jgi:hypothetical protein
MTMLTTYIFQETSPSSAQTAASSQAVQGAASWAPGGVAAGMLDRLGDSGLDVEAELVGATGGTLDVYVQYSPDQGANFFDLIHFAQLAGGAAAVKYRAAVSSFNTATVPVAVGKNNAPALAAAAIVHGPWGDRLRLLMVAGSGTTAGAAVRVTVSLVAGNGGK